MVECFFFFAPTKLLHFTVDDDMIFDSITSLVRLLGVYYKLQSANREILSTLLETSYLYSHKIVSHCVFNVYNRIPVAS